MALTADLGLEKLEGPGAAVRSPLDRYATTSGQRPLASLQGRSMEDRRALAGCFHLTSVISTSINMLTSLQYSLQLDDTCRLLEAADVRSSDYQLAKLVRLQYIISRVYQVQKDLDLGGGGFIPLATHVTAFENELNHFWSTLPDVSRAQGKVTRKAP